MAKRLTSEQRLLRSINEESWKQTVVHAARLHGWVVYFVPDRFHARARAQGYLYATKMPDAGYPDLTLVGPHSIIWVELKRETGTLSPDQEQWRDRLLTAGGEWHCWRPSQSDEMIDRLAQG